MDELFVVIKFHSSVCQCKLLECPEAQAFQQRLRSCYGSVKTVKSEATRKGSRERYLLARGFQGPAVIE